VTTLQEFLAIKGYFSVAPTGYFGPITRASVQGFQAGQGVITTGYVGPLTRAALVRLGCNKVPPYASISISSLSPASGKVGTRVAITGSGFSNSNTILMDGMLVARDVPVSSTISAVQFTIPADLSPNCPSGSYCAMYLRQVTPGSYAVTVQNVNGTSNALTLSVTTTSSGPAPTISGLDTPSTLAINQSGTWVVRVSLPSGSGGDLRYSVTWGDELVGASATSIKAPEPATLQTSATFTHSYSRSGTYTPVFTITNDAGLSASTSATISVTPIY